MLVGTLLIIPVILVYTAWALRVQGKVSDTEGYPEYAMTDWHTRAIIYQIDTALFYDLNGDGCGDIAGIWQAAVHSPHGGDVIWITRFTSRPFSMKAMTSATISRWIPASESWPISSPLSNRPASWACRVIIELAVQLHSPTHILVQQTP